MVLSTLIRSKAVRCLPVVLATLFFVGCETQMPDQSTAHLQGQAQANSAYYLQQMQHGSNDTKTNWQLLAIRALIEEGKHQQAAELYQQLPQDLSDAQRREQGLLDVELLIANKNYPGAVTALAALDSAGFNNAQKARYYQAQIDASQGRPSLELLRALIAQESLLKPADKQKNSDATWQALSTMTPEQANALVINADENALRGWLDLQRMWFDNHSDPKKLKAGIQDWQIRYPQNLGAKLLPTQLVNVQNVKPVSAKKIALLLPLNGQAAVFGRAIQQGFDAAKNSGVSPVNALQTAVAAQSTAESAQQSVGADSVASPSGASVGDLIQQATAPVSQSTASTPTEQATVSAPANPDADIKIYDTSSQPLNQVLNQVQQDGASIVVGPLLKPNVEALVRSNTPLNVLALNESETVQPHANICYFALSPEDEARDGADHIWQQGHRNPLILVPNNTLGDRVTRAFAKQWQQLGGATVLQQKFGSVSELKMGINRGSGIALTGSPVASRLPTPPANAIGGLAIPSPPTDAQIAAGSSGNGNVDAVYIVASQDEIALIKPMIAMRTGSHNGATLYASSRSAQGSTGPDFRLEMEGLQFSEIPLLAGENPGLQQQALASVNNDYSLARLYAMGVDAWSLANHFSQMRQVPGFQLSGNTGMLTANRDCIISRKLTWLKYQQGQVVPAN